MRRCSSSAIATLSTWWPFLNEINLKVEFGDKSFVSIPDASLLYHETGRTVEGPTFIVIESKRLGAGDGEYQIPGEALATAYHNYVNQQMRFAQTIFVMRIIGTFTTFYRIDFPQVLSRKCKNRCTTH